MKPLIGGNSVAMATPLYIVELVNTANCSYGPMGRCFRSLNRHQRESATQGELPGSKGGKRGMEMGEAGRKALFAGGTIKIISQVEIDEISKLF